MCNGPVGLGANLTRTFVIIVYKKAAKIVSFTAIHDDFDPQCLTPINNFALFTLVYLIRI